MVITARFFLVIMLVGFLAGGTVVPAGGDGQYPLRRTSSFDLCELDSGVGLLGAEPCHVRVRAFLDVMSTSGVLAAMQRHQAACSGAAVPEISEADVFSARQSQLLFNQLPDQFRQAYCYAVARMASRGDIGLSIQDCVALAICYCFDTTRHLYGLNDADYSDYVLRLTTRADLRALYQTIFTLPAYKLRFPPEMYSMIISAVMNIYLTSGDFFQRIYQDCSSSLDACDVHRLFLHPTEASLTNLLEQKKLRLCAILEQQHQEQCKNALSAAYAEMLVPFASIVSLPITQQELSELVCESLERLTSSLVKTVAQWYKKSETMVRTDIDAALAVELARSSP
jgi:hypothetical protein